MISHAKPPKSGANTPIALQKASLLDCWFSSFLVSLSLLMEWHSCSQRNVQASGTDLVRTWTDLEHTLAAPTPIFHTLTSIRASGTDLVRTWTDLEHTSAVLLFIFHFSVSHSDRKDNTRGHDLLLLNAFHQQHRQTHAG